MFVFLDTEFTNFVSPELLSLALVSEDGQEFYVERTDYSIDACSEFVRATVLPLFGRVPGAACTNEQLKKRVLHWLQHFPEPVNVIYDYAGDRDLLTTLLSSHPTAPATIGLKIPLGENVTSAPSFEIGVERTYSAQWPRHHALADARALMAGYQAWRAFVVGVLA